MRNNPNKDIYIAYSLIGYIILVGLVLWYLS
jgi:hypothetical protein